MVRLTSLLSNGVSFATGVITGQLLTSQKTDYEGDVWTGRRHTAQFTPEAARAWVERVDKALEEGWNDISQVDLGEENGIINSSEPPY